MANVNLSRCLPVLSNEICALQNFHPFQTVRIDHFEQSDSLTANQHILREGRALLATQRYHPLPSNILSITHLEHFSLIVRLY